MVVVPFTFSMIPLAILAIVIMSIVTGLRGGPAPFSAKRYREKLERQARRQAWRRASFRKLLSALRIVPAK